MTTWTSVTQDGSTWAEVSTTGAFASLSFGEGLFGGNTALVSWSAVAQDSSSWSAISQDTASWVQAVQSGTVPAMFELNEPLGGPVWVAVTQDS